MVYQNPGQALNPSIRVGDQVAEVFRIGGAQHADALGRAEQALRKVKNLPNPNELYLRIVEEMYEPEAVEARLGRSSATEDDGT